MGKVSVSARVGNEVRHEQLMNALLLKAKVSMAEASFHFTPKKGSFAVLSKDIEQFQSVKLKEAYESLE